MKKTFSGALFTVGENCNVTFENIVLDGEGSMILLQKDGTATVNRKTYRNADNADGIEIPFDAGNVPGAETDQPGTAPGAEASRAESVLDAETSERLKQTAVQPESRWKTKRIAALAVTFLLVGLFSAVTVLAIKKKTHSCCK